MKRHLSQHLRLGLPYLASWAYSFFKHLYNVLRQCIHRSALIRHKMVRVPTCCIHMIDIKQEQRLRFWPLFLLTCPLDCCTYTFEEYINPFAISLFLLRIEPVPIIYRIHQCMRGSRGSGCREGTGSPTPDPTHPPWKITKL